MDPLATEQWIRPEDCAPEVWKLNLYRVTWSGEIVGVPYSLPRVCVYSVCVYKGRVQKSSLYCVARQRQKLNVAIARLPCSVAGIRKKPMTLCEQFCERFCEN